LAAAEGVLDTRTTKKAANDQRIDTDTIERLHGNLADLQRAQMLGRDFRLFPGSYAPVVIEPEVKSSWYRCATSAGGQARPRPKHGRNTY
jgi:hypothetical protein